MSEPAPRRVTVTAPRRTRRTPARRAVARDIDEQTGVGAVYLDSLLRAQRRLALRTLVAFAILLGGLPLAFALVPPLVTTRLLGVPLPWLLLGLLAYPALLLGGWRYLRAAERNERDFAALAADSPADPPPNPDALR